MLWIKATSNDADMAELVDATDLKSVGTLLPCRFDSGFPHHKIKTCPCDGFLFYWRRQAWKRTGDSANEGEFCPSERRPIGTVPPGIKRASAVLLSGFAHFLSAQPPTSPVIKKRLLLGNCSSIITKKGKKMFSSTIELLWDLFTSLGWFGKLVVIGLLIASAVHILFYRIPGFFINFKRKR